MSTAFSAGPAARLALGTAGRARPRGDRRPGRAGHRRRSSRAAKLAGWDCLQRGALSAEAAERAPYLAELKPRVAVHRLAARRGHRRPIRAGACSLISTAAPAAGARALPLDRRGDHCRTAIVAPGAGTTRRCCARSCRRCSPASSTRSSALGQAIVIPAADAWTWLSMEEGRARHRHPAADGARPADAADAAPDLGTVRPARAADAEAPRREHQRRAGARPGRRSTERLGDRWPAFVEAAVQQGRKHGLRDARDLARYASLWCIWGPAFDGKPSFAWAAEILGDPRRGAALKLHQLAHRTREELQQRAGGRRRSGGAGAAPVLTHRAVREPRLPASTRASAGSPRRDRCFRRASRQRLRSRPATSASIDMMVAEAENLQEYRHAPNGWQRFAVAKLADGAVKWTRAPEEPVELAVVEPCLARAVRRRASTCASRPTPSAIRASIPRSSTSVPRVSWRGRAATPRASAWRSTRRRRRRRKPNAAPPGIAAERAVRSADRDRSRAAACATPARRSATSRWRCASTTATQWLTEVRHPAWEPMVWPASGRGRAGADRHLQAREGRRAGRRHRLAAVVARPAWRVSRRHGAALQRMGAGARQRKRRGSRSRPRRWSARPASPGAFGAPRPRRS